MDRYEARKAMVADLDALGLLVRVEDHTHNVGTHDRCKTTVEPMIKQQWFVKMDELIKPAVEGVKNGDIELIPASMDKTYYNWTDNIRDWCISRQLWWGHRIPAYYCKDCGEMTVSRDKVCTCPKCGSTNVEQDQIHLIHGSHQHYGHSQHLAGQIRHLNLTTSILQMCL